MFLQSGGRKSSRWKCSSNLEEEKNRGGNVPPIWRDKIIVMEMFLQSGGRKSSRWKRSSNLEEENHRGGNVPPIWRDKIIVMEMFLQSGGRKSSRWKRSSNLEEENHRDGNVPPIWRKKIIAVETFLRFAGRFRWCFFSSWDLQEVSADVFIGHGICRAKKTVILGEIPSLARQKSLTKLKTRGCSIYLKVTFLQSTIWRKPKSNTKEKSRVIHLKSKV